MSRKERQRMVVLEKLTSGRITLAAAASQMGVTARHAVRIKARYQRRGAAGLVHRARGRPGNRHADPAVRRRAIELYRRHYDDFGPTLAAEKMAQYHDLCVHPEALRRWLLASGDWLGRTRHRIHRRRRPRRQRFGELIQIDGCDHDWFEGRGPRCCLMIMIDDATGRIKLHMAPAETTQAALAVLRRWALDWGLPEAIYADRKSLYWSPTPLDNPRLRHRPEVHSDWGRVVADLGIELIPAYSPQAKGRVERAGSMLQDRLVKELRLRAINTIEAANAMLDDFVEDLYRRHGRAPACRLNAHRVFAPGSQEALELAFSVNFERTVARDNTISLDGQCWQILPHPHAPRPGAKVTALRAMDGSLRCRCKGRMVTIRRFEPAAQRLRQRAGFAPATPSG